MKLIARKFEDGSVHGYSFWCPACEELHAFNVAGAPPLWKFNGDTEAPTFAPSLRYLSGNQCHLFVNAGKIIYCADCKHSFAGKTVPMIDWDVEKWKPVGGAPMDVQQNATQETAAPAPATQPTESPVLGLTDSVPAAPNTSIDLKQTIEDAVARGRQSAEEQFQKWASAVGQTAAQEDLVKLREWASAAIKALEEKVSSLLAAPKAPGAPAPQPPPGVQPAGAPGGTQHGKEAGAVGDTGAHGDIGTNKK